MTTPPNDIVAMSEPPQTITYGSQEPNPGRFRSLYNSSEFSDIKITLEGANGSTYTLYAHKVVLAASSKWFDDYFKSHAGVSDLFGFCFGEGYNLDGDSIAQVLKHMYGIPVETSNQDNTGNSCLRWPRLCQAAEALGIPVLSEYAASQLEKQLEDLLGPQKRVAWLMSEMKYVSSLRGVRV
ncbi:hypothetical protein Q7P37_002092 [Cladosporium fusiforme]